jgi:hypothetical protein
MLLRASIATAALVLTPTATALADDGAGGGAAAPAAPAVAATPATPAAKPKPKTPKATRPAATAVHLRFVKPLRYKHRAFGIIGRPMFVRASMPAYVPGQKILIRAYRGGHRIMSHKVDVRRKGARGVAVAKLKTRRVGQVKFTAGHLRSPQLGRAYAKSIKLQVHSWAVSFGARGAVVDLAQRGLRRLHYRAYRTGVFDGATGRALLAYRKVNGMTRAQALGRAVLGRLIRGKGAFHPKYPKHGRHVEADLSRQVIALINKGGRVYKTFPISSGKPSTPTILGHYRFYLKTFGTNSEGMVDSNYFIRGYAIHGYPSVPNYAASHGCLRTFIADAYFIYSWVRLGDGIDVYP